MGHYVYMINSLYPEYSENFKNPPLPKKKGRKPSRKIDERLE